MDRAIADYRSAIELGYEIATSYTSIGVIYYSKGDNVPAPIESYDTALKHNSDWFPGYYNRAIIYSKIGELNKAKADLQRAIPLTNNPIMKRKLILHSAQSCRDCAGI